MLNVATIAITLVAVGIVASIAREMWPHKTAAAAATDVAPHAVENWRALVASGHRIGPVGARMKIVEFSDFECPACAIVHAEFVAFRIRHLNDVAIIYHHFPLDGLHPYARDAALASECAARQNRFEQYHDVLFAAQDSLGLRSWATFAIDAGVPNATAFDTCVSASDGHVRVNADIATGRAMKINATPTLIIGGLQFPLPPTPDRLESIWREAIATPIRQNHDDN